MADNLTDTELAYIAGIVDGEGSIYMATYPRHLTSYPAVVVAMTDRPLIQWLAAKLDASVQLHNQTNLRQHPNYRPQYRTGLTGRRAQDLLRLLMPYLRVKQHQAMLVIDLWRDGRRRDPDPSGMPPGEMRMLLAEQLGFLNAGLV